MKTINLLLMLFLAIVVFEGRVCAEPQGPVKNKTAVVYFSQTGNTRLACEVLSQKLSADLIELKVVKPPAAKGELPEIEPGKIDLEPYECVVVASPVWAANLVPAVRAFLKNNPLGGRKVAVLTTTNVPMPDDFQTKHRKFVTDAGGSVSGYYQIVVQALQDGKAVPRTKEDIQKDAIAIAAEIMKGMGR